MSAFDQLHPAVQHHVVNSLGWRSLRPLQEEAIAPLLGGESALLLAPTAGGKTEAAFFPLLSRMLAEEWSGLSVLYLCPIKALLNNLQPRLHRYATLVGRRVDIWHGDVGDYERRRIDRDPGDVLMTTPESLEVILVSRRRDHQRIFRGLRAVVVDELHAFAGDDRGWHLLSVLERVARVSGRSLQRIGLSATVGNPDELLGWLTGSTDASSRVIAPPVEDPVVPEIGLDYVGSLDNAAQLISQLHGGEKRLVFVDSRERTEKLTAALRARKVKTFVSHSSLGLDERRQAEQAFAEARDCVIVATSTLELGVDVGDLDRVIQLDSPSTVSSFLQRLGRTGRRAGTSRNCLFVTTKKETLLQAAALIRLWGEGYVEPVEAPPSPWHVLAQQIITLSLQESGIGRSRWREQIGAMPGFRALPAEGEKQLLDYMVQEEILFEDAGILSMGPVGEKFFGSRGYLDLYSVFSSPPLFKVLHGRQELGEVHEASFQIRNEAAPILLLAGRSWVVKHLDWTRRVAFVQPTEDGGRSRWLGGGLVLHARLCRAMRSVLADGVCPARLTSRAATRLEELRDEIPWVEEDRTAIVRSSTGLRWWTFAGLRANAALASALGPLAKDTASPENLSITLDAGTTPETVTATLRSLAPSVSAIAAPPITPAAIAQVKFSKCVPADLIEHMLEERLADPDAIRQAIAERVGVVSLGGQV